MFKTVVKMTAVFLSLKVDTVSLSRYDRMVDDTVSLNKGGFKCQPVLLHEFSEHSLATAQVARIVKEAGIARGAFYKYFADLKDAYQYLYAKAMRDIHQNVATAPHQLMSAQDYFEQTREFVQKVHGSRYYDLIKLHLRCNEGMLPMRPIAKIPALQWTIMTINHEAIKECLNFPTEQTMILQRLLQALQRLLENEGD